MRRIVHLIISQCHQLPDKRLRVSRLGKVRCPIVVVIMAVCLLCCGACSDESGVPYEQPPHGLVSIAHLKSMLRGNTTYISEDIAIEGYIVANDLYGEYYKSIIVGDRSGCIEICLDTEPTSVAFPISARVMVQCCTLALGRVGGGVRIGAQATSSFSVDRIAERDIFKYITLDKSTPQVIEPTLLRIDEIEEHHIGNYIELRNVSFGDKAGERWCKKDKLSGEYIDTQHSVSDDAGNSISLRISHRVSYRAEKTPSGYGRIRGIVEYVDDSYALRIVNRQIDFSDK